ncbi:hypothetical protein E2562_002690 [Oryza meyeriana var. granulata]|uniref:Uncharacterized protein n=1 Tax=Oryza meyeriana var. granulata TaxID=110450 RepID=A0A6G1BR14_9ORYZ|nr:hypothetical protein E2562_002690 [Oryza meyeriana var. granulata]
MADLAKITTLASDLRKTAASAIVEIRGDYDVIGERSMVATITVASDEVCNNMKEVYWGWGPHQKISLNHPMRLKHHGSVCEWSCFTEIPMSSIRHE